LRFAAQARFEGDPTGLSSSVRLSRGVARSEDDGQAINQLFETRRLSLATAPMIDQRQARLLLSSASSQALSGGAGEPWAPNYDQVKQPKADAYLPPNLRSDPLTSKIRPNNAFLLELVLASLFWCCREVLAHAPGGRKGD
jgi:hypothetical protein